MALVHLFTRAAPPKKKQKVVSRSLPEFPCHKQQVLAKLILRVGSPLRTPDPEIIKKTRMSKKECSASN